MGFFSQLETVGCETVLCMWSHMQVIMGCMCEVFFNHYPLLIIYNQNQNKILVVFYIMFFVVYLLTDILLQV